MKSSLAKHISFLSHKLKRKPLNNKSQKTAVRSVEHRSRKQTTYFIFRHNYQEVETDSSMPHQNPEMTNRLRLASWKRQMRPWPCNSCLQSSHPFLLQDYLRTFCQDSKKLQFRPSSLDNVHSNQHILQIIPSAFSLQQRLRVSIICRYATSLQPRQKQPLLCLLSQMAAYRISIFLMRIPSKFSF